MNGFKIGILLLKALLAIVTLKTHALLCQIWVAQDFAGYGRVNYGSVHWRRLVSHSGTIFQALSLRNSSHNRKG